MASSRVMRRSSRNSSPAAARSTRSSAAPESIAAAVIQRAAAAVSASPTDATPPDDAAAASAIVDDSKPRTPAASFDRGFALGRPRNPEPRTPSEATPGQRVKLRVKEWKPPGSEGSWRESPVAATTPQPAVSVGAASASILASAIGDIVTPSLTDSRPRRRLGSPQKLQQQEQQIKSVAGDRTPRSSAPSRRSIQETGRSKIPESPTHARNGSAASVELRSPVSVNGQAVPSSTTREGREMLRSVVEAAVSRSRELGNEILGLALQRLFEESLHNKKLAQLLDAVLAQHPTADQAAEFQNHVKNARKQIRAENPTLRRAIVGENGFERTIDDEDDTDVSPRKRNLSIQAMVSRRSPSSRPQRASTRNTPSDAPHYSTPREQRNEADRSSRPTSERPTRASARTRANGRMTDPNYYHDGPPPPKRLRRSGSVSSTSSLSSTHSYEIEMDLKPVDEMSLASKNRGGQGPRTILAANAGKRNQNGALISGNKRILDEDGINAERAEKKRKLTKSFPDYRVNDSYIRDDPNFTVKRIHVLPPTKRSGDDLLSPASSQGDLLVPPPPGALRNASSPRALTPTALGRPKKEPIKKMARVKVSPTKNKNVVVAGVSGTTRALRDRDEKPSQNSQQRESTADASSSDEGDNQDFCNACGGNGELLCCDGCVRSFHFKCLDPPMDPKRPPEGEWYCHVCDAKRNPIARATAGLFAKMEARIRNQNPVAFSLPHHVRDFFEGVTTGKDGEYEEVSILKPKPVRGIGYDDNLPPDNLRLKDGKGNWILCFRCGQTASRKREIVPCDFCGLKWHLDCLSPPLASAPLRDPANKNRPKYEWMCPAHAERDLEARGRGGRVWKQRKPKHPKYVEPDIPRATHNHGNIEIIDDFNSDAEEIQEGIVYKIPASTVILNFIEKTKRDREDREALEAKAYRKAEAERVAREERLEQRRKAFGNATFSEQSAAIALAALAEKSPEVELNGDAVPILVHELMAEAPPEIKELLEKKEADEGVKKEGGESPEPRKTEQELRELLLLEELCRRRRAELLGEKHN